SREQVGEIDLLVNNAGVAVGGHLGEIPLDDWRWIMGVNLWGVIHGCRAFVPAMKARRRGWILNVASAAGFVCLPQLGPYNVTKAGVIALSDTLRAEVAPFGVNVTVLCPSFFQTGIAESGRGDDDQTRRQIQEMMRRSKVQAEDVARVALRGLERGQLYVVPMREAQAAWIAKRLLPSTFPELIGFVRKHAGRLLNDSIRG
ncbi:MAG: SDR family NAD(P)-dependent oxidoreductase, partial [Myxococcales bacterium]|nr:SDR family NAD(P)-dependent oxidoreductase [Myxococcales bacterium]